MDILLKRIILIRSLWCDRKVSTTKVDVVHPDSSSISDRGGRGINALGHGGIYRMETPDATSMQVLLLFFFFFLVVLFFSSSSGAPSSEVVNTK